MPVDASVYSMLKPVDVVGAVEKGLSLRELADQRVQRQKALQEQEQIKAAYKAGLVTNPDGSVAVDSKKTLSALAGVSPQEAQKFEAQQSQNQSLNLERKLKETTMISQALGGVTDPQSWEMAKANLEKSGIDIGQYRTMPYDPKTVNYLQGMTLTAKDRMEAQFKERDFGLKEREVRAKEIEAAAKRREGMAGGLTEGRKAADKDYAKDFNDFTGGGATKAQDAIAKLKSLRDNMSKDTGWIQAGGGPISGSLPDAFRTQASIAQRDNIVSVANSALKATFGGQLSDGERKALANEFYNDRLNNEENLKIIDRKIQELENGFTTQKAKADYFAKRGTLTGFQPNDGQVAGGRNNSVPEPGTVESGYRFKGGNPADPNNWMKVDTSSARK